MGKPNAKRNKTAVPPAYLESIIRNAPHGAQEAARVDTPCCLHIHSLRFQLCDADGISAKYAVDGLVHAGLFPDDKAAFVEAVTYSQEKVSKAKGQAEETIITITPISGHRKGDAT